MNQSAPGGRRDRIIRPSDLWFAATLLAVAVACALVMWLRPAGDTVVFRRDGEVVAIRSLKEDGLVTLTGEYMNVFEISGGKVRVVETDCPDGTCEAAGPISVSGAAIICAPNHVSAAIEGGGGLDAYTG